jgi:butyrate kinase
MTIFYILVINPGSTSTKVALFKNHEEIFKSSISHSEKELSRFRHISDQHQFRVEVIEQMLEENAIDLTNLHATVGRGGLVRPIPSGTYQVNKKMLCDLEKAEWGEHASNLGGIIAYNIAEERGIPAYIVDPVVVDELDDVARISGMPDLERRSIFHALNQKAVARRAATDLGKSYQDVNLIVGHLGGGISIGCHKKGRVVDVNNAFDGDGPFAPERAGGLPVGQLVELCFSGQYTKAELKKRIVGNAGMVAYLGTNDMRKAKERIKNNDSNAKQVYHAMAYQVAKEIGSNAVILEGDVDAIVLSGGLAHDQDFIQMIQKRVGWIAPVVLYPGEEEMRALALGAWRVLSGQEVAKVY